MKRSAIPVFNSAVRSCEFFNMDQKLYNISVIGLGKLGYPLAACYAAKGHQVIGVDKDQQTVDAVNRGESSIYEPGVLELLQKSEGRLKAIPCITEAVVGTDVTILVVPTPSDEDGTFSNQVVLDACEAIAAGLAAKDSYHLVVLVSTVMPGSTGGEIRRKLEQASGKACGADFGLCYSPTFVALGSVVRNFSIPDMILIGEWDSRSGDMLEVLYRSLCDNQPPIARMNFINAEITKLANNTFVTTKITFGNMLSHICQELPNADVDVVTSALGLDSRVGGKYLKGALGYGGPCYPRDNIAMTAFADKVGTGAQLAAVTEQLNRQEVGRLVALVKSKLERGGTVGILGLAYKPDTDVVEESQGLLLAQALASDGITVVAYDPAAMAQARRLLGTSVSLCESVGSCIQKSQVVIITTPWKEFEEIDAKSLKPLGSLVLIDCWRILNGTEFSSVTDYVPLGVGPVSA